ncbi:hypothetical protein [Quatrionicoccus australiensis]|uniref:hypothetical protein n=1 Tax=Quatrionicoccus australiensis TaxID=138118 RepID=UPI001CF89DAD|nr:hypothetical protein [Quatrionicoccus australiensis]UCV14051.1 hypothetical protein KI612_13970 [Quatrionicoccus australiensis]
MDNQQTSSTPSNSTVFSAKYKHEVAEKTVAHLLDDKAAMDDWKNNIEKSARRNLTARPSRRRRRLAARGQRSSGRGVADEPRGLSAGVFSLHGELQTFQSSVSVGGDSQAPSLHIILSLILF